MSVCNLEIKSKHYRSEVLNNAEMINKEIAKSLINYFFYLIVFVNAGESERCC